MVYVHIYDQNTCLPEVLWSYCDGGKRYERETYSYSASRCALPGWKDRGVMRSSETKLKDLTPLPRFRSTPLSLYVGWLYTTMRWKCDTVRWDSCLGRYREDWRCVWHIFSDSLLLPEQLLRTVMTAFHREHRNPSSLHDTSNPVQSLLFLLFPQFLQCCHSCSLDWVVEGWKMWWNALLFLNNTWLV